MSLSSLVIFILPEYEQWTPSRSSSSTGHICSPLLSLTIRLLWAFSFHGWGKVWTGEKQLRRLSTTAVLVPTHSHASANSTAYTDFPQNQSESQSEKKGKKSSICSASADRRLLKHQQTSIPCPSPVWLYAKQDNRVHPELITSELGAECLPRPRQASQGKTSTSWLCCFSSSQWARMKEQRAHTHSHAQIKTACCHD